MPEGRPDFRRQSDRPVQVRTSCPALLHHVHLMCEHRACPQRLQMQRDKEKALERLRREPGANRLCFATAFAIGKVVLSMGGKVEL